MIKKAVCIAAIVIGLIGAAGCSAAQKDSAERSGAAASTATVSASAKVSASADGESPSKRPSPKSSSPPAQEAYQPATAEHPAKNVPKPVKPRNANDKTAEGQAAFIKYYFELLNYAIETHEWQVLGGISGVNCKICHQTMDVLQYQAEQGIYNVGKAYIPRETIPIITPDPQGIYHSIEVYDSGPIRPYRNGQPSGAGESAEKNRRIEVQLYRGKLGWYINDLVPSD